MSTGDFPVGLWPPHLAGDPWGQAALQLRDNGHSEDFIEHVLGPLRPAPRVRQDARRVLTECAAMLIDDVPRLMHVASWRSDAQGANCERLAREKLAKAKVVCDIIEGLAS